MPVDRDVDGWTVVTPSGDSRIVYVDASQADDSGDGLTEGAAKKTLAAGYALIRDTFPDHMLLKRGEVWYDAIPRWDKAGRSQQEPQYLSAYGTGVRPEIRNSGLDKGRGGGYFIMQSLSFYAEERDPVATPAPIITQAIGAMVFAKEGTQYFVDCLLEDCSFKMYAIGINVQSRDRRISNFTIRRCQILDSYMIGSHSQGIYIEDAENMLLEENVFDHDGWYGDRETGGSVGAQPTIFNHNIYYQYTFTAIGAVIRDNIIMRAASHGIQLRVGGGISGNLFVQNPIGAFVLWSEEPEPSSIVNNVFLDALDLASNQERAQNIEVRPNYGLLTKVTDNLVARSVVQNGVNEYGILIDKKGSEGALGGNIDNFDVSRNTFYMSSLNYRTWPTNEPVTRMVVEDNLYWDTPPSGTNRNIQTEGISLFDPTRTVETYDAMEGGAGTFDSFVASVRGNIKDNWDVKWTAAVINPWIKAGYVGNVGPATPTNLSVVVA